MFEKLSSNVSFRATWKKIHKPNVSSSTNPEKCTSNITAQPRGTALMFRCCQTVVSTSLSLWESARFDLYSNTGGVIQCCQSQSRHKLKETLFYFLLNSNVDETSQRILSTKTINSSGRHLGSKITGAKGALRDSTPAGHYRECRFKALSKLNFNFSQILYLKTRTFTELLTSSS